MKFTTKIISDFNEIIIEFDNPRFDLFITLKKSHKFKAKSSDTKPRCKMTVLYR